MVQLSAMVLAIGVPVAKTMPPPRSSSHWVFKNRSVALWHSAGLGSPFTRSSLVAKGRFFPQCTSSTSLLGLGAKTCFLQLWQPLALWRTCTRRGGCGLLAAGLTNSYARAGRKPNEFRRSTAWPISANVLLSGPMVGWFLTPPPCNCRPATLLVGCHPSLNARRIIAWIRRNARECLAIGRDEYIEGWPWASVNANSDGASTVRVDRILRGRDDIVKLDDAVDTERHSVRPRAVAIEGLKPGVRGECRRRHAEGGGKQCSGIGEYIPPFQGGQG